MNYCIGKWFMFMAGFIGGNFMHGMVTIYPADTIICLGVRNYAGNFEILRPIAERPNFKLLIMRQLMHPFLKWPMVPNETSIRHSWGCIGCYRKKINKIRLFKMR